MIACHSCHRQFDVSTLSVGAKVRCLCAELLVVPEIEVRDLVMQRCASCGGELGDGDKACSYCGSDVSLAERGYGGSCPHCFSRLAKDAKFCCSCGTGIQVAGKLQPLHDSPCPRCAETLAVQEFGDGSLVECTGCGGIWLEEGVFEKVSKEHEAHSVSKFVTGRSVPEKSSGPQARTERKVQYLKCPTCQGFMHRKNFASASGVIIDWCRGHGYWFDCHELETIIKFISEGGLDHARDLERERERAAAWRPAARSGVGAPIPLTDGSLFRDSGRNQTNLFDMLGGLLNKLF